ncbi:hypothetical protein [Tautonia sociabilis]|uniref:Uncharacterized protein n=1 Tax=Tautonia sociabilis TaxID=2080755 RepID=A0A432MF53_9BACT|nr:hypothetical protein [Tautonia sociabilis]RUL84591.1 hypothetical protein TsocGM_20155 [Tautonia sociabilis]
MHQRTLIGRGSRRKPEGGFALIPVIRIAMAWWAYARKLIRLADLRAYFACYELIARRCTLPPGRVPNFAPGELCALTGLPEKRVRDSLRRLERAGLLRFASSDIQFTASPDALPVEDLSGLWALLEAIPNRKRLVPIPRRILRLIAGGASRALIATILGHCLRCLYSWPNEGINASGTCKSSWIAATFGISLRAAKAARQQLIELGWLCPVDVPQWAMNRYGQRFEINLDWDRLDGTDAERGGAESRTFGRAGEGAPISAPPRAAIVPISAPPESDKNPLRESNNQKPAAGGPSGFFQSKQEKDSPTRKPPTLRDVVPEDLRDTERLLELHRQARSEGLVGTSEHDRLRFVAAAEHARVIGTRNPCGLFVRLVKGKLYHYLTQDDEDAANARIKRHFYGDPRKQGPKLFPPAVPERTEPRTLSEDALVVRSVKAALARVGFRGDPFYALKREKPEWTRDRWDRALAECEGRMGPVLR